MKTVLITGASRGIGFHTAHYLHAKGCHIIGIARNEAVSDFPGVLFRADLSNAEETLATLTEIRETHSVNCIVNNVGDVLPEPLEQVQLTNFKHVQDINLRTALQTAQVFVPTMKANQFGRIINIASRAMLGKVGRTSYACAKAGMVALTRTWALELAEYGITVNAIAPGPIETEGFSMNYPHGSPERSAMMSIVPMGRCGLPDEIAHAIDFFLNPQAGFITGQTLFVDGGASISTVVI